MKLDFFCPRWGSEAIDWDVFASQVQSDGFVGVEVYPLDDPERNKTMLDALQDHGLDYILLHAVLNEDGRDFHRYMQALERNLHHLLTFRKGAIQPRFIVSQTGREYYSAEQMAVCFELCDRIAKESGITILQETHRNKWSYAAHVVREYLLRDPSIQLALDLSHWVCVSESFLADQQDAVGLAIMHAQHIHARVGHTQGSQVTDPRAPENQEALQAHLAWWDKWVTKMEKQEATVATITPEFGPHPYMVYKPYTVEPIVNQYEINCWMKDFLQERYCKG